MHRYLIRYLGINTYIVCVQALRAQHPVAARLASCSSNPAGARRVLRTTLARTSGKRPASGPGLGYRPLATASTVDVGTDDPYPERDRLLFGSLHLVGGALLHTTRVAQRLEQRHCVGQRGRLDHDCQRQAWGLG